MNFNTMSHASPGRALCHCSPIAPNSKIMIVIIKKNAYTLKTPHVAVFPTLTQCDGRTDLQTDKKSNTITPYAM